MDGFKHSPASSSSSSSTTTNHTIISNVIQLENTNNELSIKNIFFI
jgi:hypothetical protein